MTFAEYEAIAREKLSERRFYHSKCVAECAAHLAEIFGADVQKAKIAGILHDIMKEATPEEQLKMLEKADIILTEAEMQNPVLWHAPAGAAYVRQVLGINDCEVISAIRCHTSGKAEMTALEKVLFVADFISADRTYPGVEELRRAAEKNLETVIVEGIAFTVTERMAQHCVIEPQSIAAYNEALLLLKSESENERK